MIFSIQKVVCNLSVEADQISHWLMDHELHHLASLFEMEELMSWELIKKLDVEMLRRLGLTFGMILKFTQLLEGGYSKSGSEFRI